MRIAIVDDIETERALLKMRLERQLSLYGVETEILEFDSSESLSLIHISDPTRP